ncbi:VapC toxin family PIN domain ribonuclease, partial [Candidatus Gottesmanbacteria bacterium]|nr:VapC toxin family PIN domain ribonuclease [Candidatus Gottesmanbacteria bacterium]
MILLDTQAIVWWVQEQPSRLSRRARGEIAKAEKEQALAASAMSIWEICLLVKSERLQLGVTIEQWL